MKKILVTLFVLVILLLAAYCGASYWTGIQAQKQYELMCGRVSQSSNMRAVTKTYERGVFKSRAVTSVTITGAGSGPDQTLRFTLENFIHHGPLSFETNRHLKSAVQPVQALIWTRLAPGTEDRKELRELLDTLPELIAAEFLTVLALDGSGESYLDIPALSKVLPSGESGETLTIEWKGLSAQARFDVSLGEITGSFSAPQCEIVQKRERFYLNGFKGDFNSHPGPKGVMVGSGAMFVDKVGFDLAGQQVFLLKSSRFQAESGAAGDAIHCTLRLGFDGLLLSGEDWGPLTMELEARKLSPEGLLQLEEATRKVNALPGGITDDNFAELFTRYYKGALAELLSKSPEFELKQLLLKTRRGDFTGKLKIAFAGSADVTGNVFLLLNSINAGAELAVSEALFHFFAENIVQSTIDADEDREEAEIREMAREGARNVAQALLSQNVMVSENGFFRSNATYESGRLTLNGRKIALDDMLKGLGEE